MVAYRDLLDASIADEELARECDEQVRRLLAQAKEARIRVANRAPELNRRRMQVESFDRQEAA